MAGSPDTSPFKEKFCITEKIFEHLEMVSSLRAVEFEGVLVKDPTAQKLAERLLKMNPNLNLRDEYGDEVKF